MFQTHTPPNGSHLIVIELPEGSLMWADRRVATAMARNDARYDNLLQLQRALDSTPLCSMNGGGDVTVLDVALDRHAHGRAALLDDACKRLDLARAPWARYYDRDIAERCLINGFKRRIVSDLYYGLSVDDELYVWEPTFLGAGVVRSHWGDRTTIVCSDGTSAAAHHSSHLRIGEAVGAWWVPTLDRSKPGCIIGRRLSSG